MRKKTFIANLILLVALSSCNLPGALTSTPTANQQAVEPPSVNILIANPSVGETFPALAPIPVSVEISGDVQSVELLVDGEIFESGKAVKHRKAKWDWVSSVPGKHSLQAKAMDANGNTYTSNPINIWISESASQSTFLYTPQSGDTVDSLAARFNTSPKQILQFNPFLGDGSAPLPLNQPLKILNVYPTQFLAQFPILEFKQAESDSPSNGGASLPQTHFEENAPKNIFTSPDLVFADRVYYYMSLDGSPWSRFPRLEGEFITPKNGFFDLDEILANLIASKPSKDLHVEVDAWGWQGGSLIYIGRFERIITANENNEPWVILPGQLEICDRGTYCTQGEVTGNFVQNANTNEGGMYTLRWHSPFGASDGLWQTSTQPFTGACELEPAYLYTHGYVGSVGDGVNFEVEFPPYYGEPLLFYARVLPIVNGQPDCTSSNIVTLTLTDAEKIEIPQIPYPPAPPEAYDIVITDFKPIHFPDYTYHYCVTITENPFYEPEWFLNGGDIADLANLDKVKWYDIAPGTNLCPAPYVYEEPSVWEEIGNFLKDAINVISEVYNGLKNFVIDIIAEYNPICLQANLVVESQAVKDACHAVAEIAVNAAMTYVGLPPSLPNYDELIETGKGELTDLIAQQLEEQTGIPCPDECKELIRDGMDAAIEEVQAAYADAGCMGESEAHSNGIEPLCIPDTIKVIPMHEGQLEPATLIVQVTRRADAPDSAFPDPQSYKTNCRVDISSNAQNDSWIGQQVFLGNEYYSQEPRYWQGQSISGNPFKGVNSPMPTLAPGESTTLSFALRELTGVYPPGQEGFWLPGRTAIYSDYYYGSQLASYYNEFQDDWKYLYFGSSLKMTAEAYCRTTFLSAPEGFPQGIPLDSIGSKSSTSDEWLEQIPALGE